MKDFKKVYIKAYTKLNLGDDLFVFILCSRYPQTHFYIKASTPFTDVFKKINNISIIQDISCIDYDLIVYIGGSIFMETSKDSISKLHSLKEEILKDSIPTYIIGANFGPYKSNEYFLTAKKELFPYMKCISFRDNYSYNLFRDLDNAQYAPDIVFSMNTDTIHTVKKREIGISIIHHLERDILKQHYNTYINKLLQISRFYINKGYKIRLFSFCEYEKDMIAINTLLAKFTQKEKENIFISNYTGDIDNIVCDISNLELFITSRFHSMVLGLKLGVPIFPISYSDKSSNLLLDLGIAKDSICTFQNLGNINCKNLKTIYLPDKINLLTTNTAKHFKELDNFLTTSDMKILI